MAKMGLKVNHCGGKRQEEMVKNGWWLELRESYSETPEEMYERLSKHWEKVKVYWEGTRVRGIHTYFAFCKGRKYGGKRS